jgi:uncharacterized protein involved in exopolysaccharide biosynthesis
MSEESPTTSHESLVTSHSDEEISLLDLLVVLAENARLLVLGPLAAGLIALGYSFLITPTFTATTKILPPQQQQSASAMLASQLGALTGLAGAAGLNLKNPADLYVALLKSRTVADRLIDRFDLMQVYEAKFRMNARKALEDSTRVTAGRDGLITIEVDDTDPKRAADIANAYVEELGRLNDNLAITEAQQRRVFFERQLKDAKAKLAAAESALAAIGVGTGAIRASPQATVEAVAQLRAQVTAQEVRLAAMRGYLTDAAPELRKAQMELAALRAQLKQSEATQPDVSSGDAYVEKYRDFKYHETLFELMAKQYEAARLDEAREGVVVQVVDVAQVPEWKSKPRKALIAVLTTLVAGFVLLIFVFVQESLRKAGNDPANASKLNRLLCGLRRFVPGKP